MCLGEVGRVVGLLDERRAVVEYPGRQATALLDVVRAEGVDVGPGDVVIVSMGFVLAIADETELAVADQVDREGVRR